MQSSLYLKLFKYIHLSTAAMGRSGGAQPAIFEDQLIDENNFSEEEEALYVAENDSEMESDPQATRQGQDLELSNVTVFRRGPAASPEAEQHVGYFIR
jgi:hypothetical protein